MPKEGQGETNTRRHSSYCFATSKRRGKAGEGKGKNSDYGEGLKKV